VSTKHDPGSCFADLGKALDPLGANGIQQLSVLR
jgi:hypothetical protein